VEEDGGAKERGQLAMKKMRREKKMREEKRDRERK